MREQILKVHADKKGCNPIFKDKTKKWTNLSLKPLHFSVRKAQNHVEDYQDAIRDMMDLIKN